MNVFDLRRDLIADYASYISSFIRIRDPKIENYVNQSIEQGLLWPDPLIQLNPTFQPGLSIDDLSAEGVLHPTCKRIFRRKSTPADLGQPLRLHKHQEEAVRTAHTGQNYILTTGTGSGKSLAYILPIVDFVLRHGSGKGIQAIIVYPMNALANSQMGELEKFLHYGFADGKGPVTFARYTGQESDLEKKRIMANPPDILLTNYVMLELILTRPADRQSLVNAAQSLRFLVLDELHTYRGRQGADVAMLVRRVREALHAELMQCIGTSATLAGAGNLQQQRAEVASVAAAIFGAPVIPENVIGETLRRATAAFDPQDAAFQATLRQAVQVFTSPASYEDFIQHPLARWVESVLGLTVEPETGRLLRATPKSLTGGDGVAQQLVELTGLPEAACVRALQALLLQGYAITNPVTHFPAFAFRLHQFISRGDTVYASLEAEDRRYLTVYGQQYVPGDRTKVLLPLAFCRECGQEYYVVHKRRDVGGSMEFTPRELHEHSADEGGEAGFLYLNTAQPWPEDVSQAIDRLPDEWVEEHGGELRVKRSQRKNLPQTVILRTDGTLGEPGTRAAYLGAPFRFCLHCGVTYGGHQSSDFAKLTELSSGGRSTDTTILSLSLIRRLRRDSELSAQARKLLSFTDNRQDAALQAGHFNDFVDITLLRAALYRAVKAAGTAGITHEVLPQRVFDALNLPLAAYAVDPDVRFAKKSATEKALREVLAYRLYRDLKRGWRITSPNLEQSGLLHIEYLSLDELCASEEDWQNCHPALAAAAPETRLHIARVLLDYMRRELAIKVSYLLKESQESMRQESNQHLAAPWALDESENLEHAAILFPRPRLGDKDDEYGGNVYVSPRGGYGQFLRRSPTFPDAPTRLSTADTTEVIDQILNNLRVAGLVERVVEAQDDPGYKPGYQLLASGMIWKVGAGTQAFHDPIRVPRFPEGGGQTNDFFVQFYQTIENQALGIEAREHTAQVPSAEREEREARFRRGDLPILYCSPTMELGVDISELDAVNMRNVPPTPANYAQRSGRAGRSGQPALVFTYCTVGSPHDSYYFKRPSLMVAGAVKPPRIDLTNEDLLRSHVQAIWLAETGLSLGVSLNELLDLNNVPDLPCLPSVQDALNSLNSRAKARRKAQAALHDLESDLARTDWWHADWLDSVLAQIDLQFNQACERWRSLYRSAMNQLDVQQRIIKDASRPKQDKDTAGRLHQEARNQLALLTEGANIAQSDFYSYRYFASEGFLPGYSFPRLPLSAYIPARRVRTQHDEFLSRPRFLAISEFGPRAIIYHEGSRYMINRVSLPASESGEGLATVRAKQCPVCGYLHPITDGDGLDRCEHCNALLEAPLNNLFRLQNVATKRRDRISSDEEERVRQGYDLRTAIRFRDHGGVVVARRAEVQRDGAVIGTLTYGPSATLWRMNLGWRRRANPQQFGFILDTERGYWAKNEAEPDAAPDDPMSPRKLRVVPFVEAHKNSLIFEPSPAPDQDVMASLQAALKNAIQVAFQLEDSELAAEPLPTAQQRQAILFFEAAEGGAGVLRRLVDDPTAFALVADHALRLCHFDPETGADLHHAPHAKEACEAACYDCLMSYTNQTDHRLLDRQLLKDLLLDYRRSALVTSHQLASRAEHYQGILTLCQSDLERDWLAWIEQHSYRLPSHAQPLIEGCHTRPDFLYELEHAAIYIDGPHHRYPERQQRDRDQTDCMEDTGYTVIRFSFQDDWQQIVNQYPSLFGATLP